MGKVRLGGKGMMAGDGHMGEKSDFEVRAGGTGMMAGDGHMGGKSYFVDMVLESKCE